jgi:hypothetical protein
VKVGVGGSRRRKSLADQPRRPVDYMVWTDLGFDNPLFITESASSAKRLAKQAAENERAQKVDELDLLMLDKKKNPEIISISVIFLNIKSHGIKKVETGCGEGN